MTELIHLQPKEFDILKRMINYKQPETYGPEATIIPEYFNKKYRKVLTPNIKASEGWVTGEYIEGQKPSPYRKNRRWDYLTKSLCNQKKIIQVDKFKYIGPRGGKPLSWQVYRIRKDPETYKNVHLIFHSKHYLPYFASDYINDNIDIVTGLIRQFIKYMFPNIKIIKEGDQEQILELNPNTYLIEGIFLDAIKHLIVFTDAFKSFLLAEDDVKKGMVDLNKLFATIQEYGGVDEVEKTYLILLSLLIGVYIDTYDRLPVVNEKVSQAITKMVTQHHTMHKTIEMGMIQYTDSVLQYFKQKCPEAYNDYVQLNKERVNRKVEDMKRNTMEASNKK